MAGFIINRQLPILFYIVLLILTHLFGVPTVRRHAIDAIPLPEPREKFIDMTDRGMGSGGHYYHCDTHAFIPFLVFVEYDWRVVARDSKGQSFLSHRGNGDACYFWIPGIVLPVWNSSNGT
jgi:hypothetical protein